ncbi:GNAT family N-acetyltransferase [Pseudodesulfovibrio cashew]|uniref:GNAT family N-acetyltransferase n=1 Tax=Pseudodesulfovibrio cashew TaxID=2678688 RepID=A0A6I6J882_9BACT|nr:GNAT family protein [Pseudodesulfovibrio cashew]QGY38765.1 GNAT family N-acetyltransferase [Pseudodesulfovibrio cashew]
MTSAPPPFADTVLLTRRCVMRPWQDSDVALLPSIASTRKISWNTSNKFPYPFGEPEAQRLLRFSNDGAGEDVWQFAVEFGGELAGSCGAIRGTDVQAHTATIGYWLGVDYWGKGIATEMVARLVDYMTLETDIEQLTATCYGWNPASARVLEKAGFEREGVRRGVVKKWGETTDLLIYGRPLA